MNASRLMDGVWRAITEQAIVGTDTDGRIDVWNGGAEGILGYTETEALGGMSVLDLLTDPSVSTEKGSIPAGDDAPVTPAERFTVLATAVSTGRADVREWICRRKDGSAFPASVASTSRFDSAGQRAGYLFVATDQTKAKEIERLKDEFSGLISHELRTPLSSILGYTELLRLDDDPPLSPSQRNYLGVVERNARRLLQLVGDLLFTAQVEAGRFSIERVPIDVEALLRASVETARPQAEKGGIVVELEGGDAPPHLLADPTRLAQAVDNLVSNAVKFTPRGGRVTLSSREENGRVLITVVDTGVGIPADELGRLSERFFRASTATKNAVQGVGLGLTITKAIIAAHGGTLRFESVLGEGATITIDLPAGH